MKGEGDEFGQVARDGTGRGKGLSAEDIRPMLSLIAAPVKTGWPTENVLPSPDFPSFSKPPRVITNRSSL